MNLRDGMAAEPVSGAAAPALPPGVRILFFHKHRTSARLRFLMFASGMVAPSALDPTAVVSDAVPASSVRVAPHPALIAAVCSEHFRLARGELRIDGEFRLHGEERGSPFTLMLAEFLAIDPPLDHAARVGGRFVAITEARGLGTAEREVLRRAYAHLLG